MAMRSLQDAVSDGEIASKDGMIELRPWGLASGFHEHGIHCKIVNCAGHIVESPFEFSTLVESMTQQEQVKNEMFPHVFGVIETKIGENLYCCTSMVKNAYYDEDGKIIIVTKDDDKFVMGKPWTDAFDYTQFVRLYCKD